MHRGMTPTDMFHVGLFMLSCEHEMHILYLAYIPFSIIMRNYLKMIVDLFQDSRMNNHSGQPEGF